MTCRSLIESTQTCTVAPRCAGALPGLGQDHRPLLGSHQPRPQQRRPAKRRVGAVVAGHLPFYRVAICSPNLLDELTITDDKASELRFVSH